MEYRSSPSSPFVEFKLTPISLPTLPQRNPRRVALFLVAEFLGTSSAASQLVLNIITAVSQWERVAIGDRTRDAMSHKRSQGERVGNVAYSFWLADDGQHLEPHPSEQAAVAEIRRLRGSGTTMCGIAAALNHRSFRTQRVRRGGWSQWPESSPKSIPRPRSNAPFPQPSSEIDQEYTVRSGSRNRSPGHWTAKEGTQDATSRGSFDVCIDRGLGTYLHQGRRADLL